MSDTILALDGTNLAHRVFHAGAATTDAALSAFVAFTARLVTDVDPARLVVALDRPGGCPARRALAPGYKAGRRPTDAALREALDRLPDVLARIGVAAVGVDDWEADDVLASVAAQAGPAPVVVVSADKDLHQVLSATVTVRKPDGVLLTAAALEARYGVPPSRWVEFAALVGEGADNLDGVPGVGPKRAAALLAAVADVEELLVDPSRPRPGVPAPLAARVADHAATVRRNRQVGTLRTDLPVAGRATVLADLDPRAFHVAADAAGVGAGVGALTAWLARRRRPAA